MAGSSCRQQQLEPCMIQKLTFLKWSRLYKKQIKMILNPNSDFTSFVLNLAYWHSYLGCVTLFMVM